MKINQYLSESKKAYSTEIKTTIVLGNEAADLDSMASSVLYGYFLSLTGQQALPVINVPRNDFKLRTEAVYLFNEAGIDLNGLTFIDEVDLESLYSKGNMELVLIDHNKLATVQAAFESSIVEILDHHADEGCYPSDTETDIRPVGSAATLVSQHFLRSRKEAIDQSTGTLLLGTILLDTVNLDPEAGRVTDSDSEAAAALIGAANLDQKALFDKLQFEKFNVSALGSYDLLRKDYKEWQMGAVKCGIGSVLLPALDWIKKDQNILDAFQTYLKERKLDVLLAMNAFTDPAFTRNLVVFVPDETLNGKVTAFLESSDLKLERIETSLHDENKAIHFYTQGHLGMSRKKLQPLLVDFFKN